mgnify:FL=1
MADTTNLQHQRSFDTFVTRTHELEPYCDDLRKVINEALAVLRTVRVPRQGGLLRLPELPELTKHPVWDFQDQKNRLQRAEIGRAHV